MTQNRKRGRNIHEDEIEFMPLSKRINNLHINNSLLMNGTNGHVNTAEWGPGPPFVQSNSLPSNIPTPHDSVQSLDWINAIPRYSPELSETENPYYFNINKLLFEMYVERQQRNGSDM